METTTVTQQIEFKPFRAWRYDAKKAPFKDVIAPPYDVINEDEQQALYDRSAYNCIRLILGKEESSDNETSNRYTRARDFYEQWKKEGTLIQEETPAYYLYKQTYKDVSGTEERSRISLLGSLKLVPFEDNLVVPHEKTLDGPKKDRRALMEHTQANFSPIFGLFPDASQMDAIFEKTLKTEALYDVVDEAGVGHTLWLIQGADDLKVIEESLSKQKIYIADGHHRYTTALHYAQDMRKQKGAKEGETLPSDYLLMALVNFSDPGLILEPTHRVLIKQENFNAEENLAKLSEYFEVEKMPADELCVKLRAEADKVERGANYQIPEKPSLGLLLGASEGYFLTLKNFEGAKSKMPTGKNDMWYRLDVNLVNHLVLSALWGYDETQWEANLRFKHADRDAIDIMNSGEASAVFLLPPLHVEVLEKMGTIRELMPQKSTYFYPKLASGFLFHHHEYKEG